MRSCSDSIANTAAGEEKPPWEERKRRYLEHLRTAPDDVLLVSLCDKLHNARAILRDRRDPAVGESIWDRFSQPREKTLWYYGELTKSYTEAARRGKVPVQIAQELHETVALLEQD